MGGILSNEEKASRSRHHHHHHHHHRREDSTLGVPWDAHGYRYKEHRKKGHRNHRKRSSRHEERDGSRARSQSLDAILEELYMTEVEGDTGRGTLIPRAKLAAGRGGAEGKGQGRKSLSQLGSDTASLHAIHLHVEKKAIEKSKTNLRTSISLPFLDQSEWVGDMEADDQSNGPPSYSKDFDACMRQLETMEAAKGAMEVSTLPRNGLRDVSPFDLDEEPRSLTVPRGRNVKRQMTPTNDTLIEPPAEETIEHHIRVNEEKVRETVHEESEFEIGEEQVEEEEEEKPAEVVIHEDEIIQVVKEKRVKPKFESRKLENIIIIEPENVKRRDGRQVKRHVPPHGWYNNLKEQFEKLDKELGSRARKQESSCRITGATLKGSKEIVQSDDRNDSKTKLYFSQLVRSNKSLIDEELPDPDKVQNIRAMFQENNTRLGGSLQNISTQKGDEPKPERPKSALGSRKEDELRCLTPETADNARRSTSTLNPAMKGSQADKHRQRSRWTDSGSMSSGVSSDLSSCETDQESSYRDPENGGSSEDELDVAEKHYIQNEIMERIRSFGTSVTYFGGQMIRCSVGPLVSPTTQAILEEIGQKQPNGIIGTRTFDEFYKKYKQAKKRKVGRTRSFAQEEMFQRNSVFTDSEIEQHKNELETAFGIRRPKGKLTQVKNKLGKSISLDSQLQNIDSDTTIVTIPYKAVEKIPKKETVSDVPRTAAPLNIPKKTRAGHEFFEFNYHFPQPKIDMDFEEFEIAGDIDRRNAPTEKKENGYSMPQHGNSYWDSKNNASLDSTPELIEDYEIVPAPPKKIISRANQGNGAESSGSETIENEECGSDDEFKMQRENSVKQKRDSWEEVIQRARQKQEALTVRKDTVPNDKDGADKDVSEIIEKANTIVAATKSEEKVSQKVNGNYESSTSINSNNAKAEEENSRMKVRRKNSEAKEVVSGKNDDKKTTSIGETKVTDSNWKNFVQHRRHNSIESFISNNKNTNYDSNTGSRRNSVKKLEDNEMNHRDFCLEKRRNSCDSAKVTIGGRRFSIDSAPWQQKDLGRNEKNTVGKSLSNQKLKNESGRGVKKSETEAEGVVSVQSIGSDNGTYGQTRKISQTKENGNILKKELTKENGNILKRELNEKTNKIADIKSKIPQEQSEKKEQTEYKITIKISQSETEPYKISSDKFEEIVINDQEPMDSLEFYYQQPETNDNEANKKGNGENTKSSEESAEQKRRFDKNKNYKSNISRWPVETSVVVDMQKKDETIPKLISQGKSHVKTTRRLF